MLRVSSAALLGSPLDGLVKRLQALELGPDGLALHLPAARGAGYGPLRAAGPELALPDGFQYIAFGVEGTPLSDGRPTPHAHDGMAAFPLPNGNVRLVRNHEDAEQPANARLIGDPGNAYDIRAGGGTTSLEIGVEPDGTPVVVNQFVSLSGTAVNCAGGPTPWGSWLSCEETTSGLAAGWDQPHGYVFEVPAAAESEVPAVPLRGLGRFIHEAVAVDSRTGIVYLTEDRIGASGFYRFIPNQQGQLGQGGTLEMLAVRDRPGYDTITGQRMGQRFPVEWVPIDDPDPANAEAHSGAVFDQGFARGGATFSRLEGCWYGKKRIFFHATNGGDQRMGQVWAYRPRGKSGGDLTLLYESPSPAVLNGPDNITLSPRGSLLICEDGAGDQHLRGLTANGEIFDFARNIANRGEFAGACFSPSGRTLFVNIQGDRINGTTRTRSMTFAIWGRWKRGLV